MPARGSRAPRFQVGRACLSFPRASSKYCTRPGPRPLTRLFTVLPLKMAAARGRRRFFASQPVRIRLAHPGSCLAELKFGAVWAPSLPRLRMKMRHRRQADPAQGTRGGGSGPQDAKKSARAERAGTGPRTFAWAKAASAPPAAARARQQQRVDRGRAVVGRQQNSGGRSPSAVSSPALHCPASSGIS